MSCHNRTAAPQRPADQPIEQYVIDRIGDLIILVSSQYEVSAERAANEIIRATIGAMQDVEAKPGEELEPLRTMLELSSWADDDEPPGETRS
jgi:hypothetical protein